jgi:hypothetical protein
VRANPTRKMGKLSAIFSLPVMDPQAKAHIGGNQVIGFKSVKIALGSGRFM